jgi:hypothetical protein
MYGLPTYTFNYTAKCPVSLGVAQDAVILPTGPDSLMPPITGSGDLGHRQRGPIASGMVRPHLGLSSSVRSSLVRIPQGRLKMRMNPLNFVRVLRSAPGRRALVLCLALCAFGLSYSATADEPTFETFDLGIQTTPTGINARGDVTGYYWDASYAFHGFLRERDGKVTEFEAPGSGTGSLQGTHPTAINADGTITGFYNFQHGFVRANDGTFTTFDPPNSAFTNPTSIAPDGAITGQYFDTTAALAKHGFLRTSDGVIVTFNPPGSVGTYPMGINPKGEIAGFYFTNQGSHGFLRARDGTFTTFDVPGYTEIYVSSINQKGEITGYYSFAYGFLRDRDGNITKFDPPGSIQSFPASINPAGEITGYYLASGRPLVERGFVRAVDGTISVFDVPGSHVTIPTSMNPEGAITGYYFSSSIQQAFVRGPDKGNKGSDVDPAEK